MRNDKLARHSEEGLIGLQARYDHEHGAAGEKDREQHVIEQDLHRVPRPLVVLHKASVEKQQPVFGTGEPMLRRKLYLHGLSLRNNISMHPGYLQEVFNRSFHVYCTIGTRAPILYPYSRTCSRFKGENRYVSCTTDKHGRREQTMLTHIRYLIRVFWSRFSKKGHSGSGIDFVLDDEMYCQPSDVEDMLADFGIEDRFRDCRDLAEYNKDFLMIFKVYRRDFLIDYSQKDGHFRV
ncbi:MAG: hypothetical protein ABFD70_05605 [Syntrophaceae bacterium]|nr:hypothetical protein [Deltaproteobacteria bacterium]